jgi:Photosynthesis affected mutant 68
MRHTAASVIALSSLSLGSGFVLPASTASLARPVHRCVLHMASPKQEPAVRGVSDEPKGFGKVAKQVPATKKKGLTKAKSAASSSSPAAAAADDDSNDAAVPTVAGPTDKDLQAAQIARDNIKRMEAERAERDAAQKQRMADIKAAQRVTREDPNAGVIPDLVANRMLARMIPFFILPVAAGVGVFVYFFVLANRYDTGFEPGMVALATQAPFAISLLGITYAIISASWDPEVEGSKLGLAEFGMNMRNILEGLRRSSER